ncbi:twin-arginine translocase TatA/TatE family subunit [bacterium]|nr:twin-arginine translocase TatA/TatE family subunit [bacterium]
MGHFGITEIVIIAGVVILLFGARKIPELMRGLGIGVKEFKSGLKDDVSEDDETDGGKKKDEESEKV